MSTDAEGATDKRERSKLTRLACCTTKWSNEQCRESMEGVHGSFMPTVADGDGLAGRLSRLLGLL